jgi:DNA-directed RNA polymerase omega subunit
MLMFKLPENLESTYRFVTLASMRAEQLQAGALPRLKSEHRKVTVIAQEEVAAGLVEAWDPDAAESTDAGEAGGSAGEDS